MRGSYRFGRAFRVFHSSPHPSALRAATFPRGEGQGRGKTNPVAATKCGHGVSLRSCGQLGEVSKGGAPAGAPPLVVERGGLGGERVETLSPECFLWGCGGAILSRKNSPPRFPHLRRWAITPSSRRPRRTGGTARDAPHPLPRARRGSSTARTWAPRTASRRWCRAPGSPPPSRPPRSGWSR